MSLIVDIHKKYEGFSLDVAFESQGGRLGILGASGCGKSLMLKTIAGVEKPDRGYIELNGTVLYDSKSRFNACPQKRRVGYLFQNYALFPHMTVGQNIGVSLKGTKIQNKISIEDILCVMHMEGMEKRYPNQLSGGQKQRVALARLLVYEPEILMLDEPFSALDTFLKDQLQKQLLDILKLYGKDVLLVTHSRDEVYKFCKNLIIMDNGKVLQRGNTKDKFKSPGNTIVARLTGCKNISTIHKKTLYEVEAIAWGVPLKLKDKIEEEMQFIGIRAYELRIESDITKENTFPFLIKEIVEGPFERDLILENPNYHSNEKEDIWLKIKKNDGNQNLEEGESIAVYFPPESIMLLE